MRFGPVAPLGRGKGYVDHMQAGHPSIKLGIEPSTEAEEAVRGCGAAAGGAAAGGAAAASAACRAPVPRVFFLDSAGGGRSGAYRGGGGRRADGSAGQRVANGSLVGARRNLCNEGAHVTRFRVKSLQLFCCHVTTLPPRAYTKSATRAQ